MKKTLLLLFVGILVQAECSPQKASVKLIDDEPPPPPVMEDDNVPEEKKGRKLVWNDEFNAGFDGSKWGVQTGDGSSYGIPGWGNNEKQYYREQNLQVAGGNLQITARKESFDKKDYTSSRIRTGNEGSWQYGWIEAKIKLPRAEQGLWPAFWMLPNTPVSWPRSGEIDIMEWVARDPAKIHGTVHFFSDEENKKAQNGKSYSGSFAETWHVYAIEWTESSITWYVDGREYHTVTKQQLASWPFSKYEFHILINMAVGGNWPGDPDNTTNLPATMEVDYVRVYQ